MRVLYVLHSFPPHHWRGTEVYGLELATALTGLGLEPRVFHLVDDLAALPGAVTMEDAEFRGIAVHQARLRIDPADLESYFFHPALEDAFRALVRRLRPDIVHFLYYAGGLPLSLPHLARDLNRRVFITVTDFSGFCPRAQLLGRDGRPCPGPRGGLRCAHCLAGRAYLDGHSRIDRLLREHAPVALADRTRGPLQPSPELELLRRRFLAVREAFAEAAEIIFPNENCRRRYRKAGIFDGEGKTRVMDYGIDLAPFQNHRKSALEDARARIGFIGQLLPHKGLHVLAAALDNLPGDWRLIVYGDAESGAARDYLAGIRLPADAEFRGTFPFERMNEVLEGIDILAVPSQWEENCPLIVKYALATGTIAVLADQPGIVADRAKAPGAIFFRHDDPADLRRALAEALQRLRENRSAGPASIVNIHDQAAELANLYSAAEKPR